jgi:lipopolysaccharide export system permease protein
MIIWKHLFFQFLKSILGVLLFALFIYFTITYIEERQHYFDTRSVSGETLFFYYFWQIPTITIQLLPFAVLIGAIIANWIMARHGEIAALRAAGASMMRIARPLLCVGILCALFQFAVSEFIVPYTSTELQILKTTQINNKPAENMFTESPWLKSQDDILHYKKYDAQHKTLSVPELFEFEPGSHHIKNIIHGEWASFDSTANRWVIHNARIFHFSFPKQTYIFKNDEVKTYLTKISFAPPQILNEDEESSQVSLWQLHHIIQNAIVAGSNVSNRVVDLHLKISLPFANVLFVFLTLPFALKKERQEENYIGIIICLCAALAYWFGNLAFKNFGAKEVIHPIIAAWFMNVVLAILSYLFIRKLDKGQ